MMTIRSAFDACAGDNGMLAASQLAEVLLNLGCVALRADINSALGVAGFAVTSHLDYIEFLRFLSAHRSAHGFSHAELSQARRSFNEFSGPLARLPGDKLGRVLTHLLGTHALPDLRRLLRRLANCGCQGLQSQGWRFSEVVGHIRWMRNAELSSLHAAFADADKDGDGLLSRKELAAMMARLGWTIFSQATNEFLEEALLSTSVSDDDLFPFDVVVYFARACKRDEGFSRQERSDLNAVYHRFDFTSSGELEFLRVVDILEWMGFSENVETVRQMVEETDLNGNGTMDVKEFLHMMRKHKEEEIVAARTVYDAHRQGASVMCSSSLELALQELRLVPLEEEAWQDFICGVGLGNLGLSDQTGVPFEVFIQAASSARQCFARQRHVQADFTDEEFTTIRQAFEERRRPGFSVLGRGEFLWLLIEFSLSWVTEPGGRAKAQEMLEDARGRAHQAGVPAHDIGRSGTTDVSFPDFVFFLRAAAQMTEEARTVKERLAIAETGFSIFEVASFRDVFAEWTSAKEDESHGAGLCSTDDGSIALSTLLPSAPKSRAVSYPAVVGLDRTRTHLGLDGLQKMLRHAGVRLTSLHDSELRAKVVEITSGDSLDFADLLRFMRWTLDSDFADVRKAAAETVTRLRESDELNGQLAYAAVCADTAQESAKTADIKVINRGRGARPTRGKTWN